MKRLSDMGFSRDNWHRNERGEYWVIAQMLLLLGFFVLPPLRLGTVVLSPPWLYLSWGAAALCAGIAAGLMVGGTLALGDNLTPLPYPKEDGMLVRSGVYDIVRHPLYSSLIFVALAWSLFQMSGVHGLATIGLFLFFNAKATREEAWLANKYADYSTYQQQVKKLIPWVY